MSIIMSPPDGNTNSPTALLSRSSSNGVGSRVGNGRHGDNNNTAASSQSSTTTASTPGAADPSPYYIFLTPHAARELPHYQYKGEDRSLLYKYILSPLASWCVHHITPSWLAPNTVTLIGLIFMTVSYLIFWYYYDPPWWDTTTTIIPVDNDTRTTLQQHDNNNHQHCNSIDSIPRWIFLFNAIAILLYQTLDNMDGKQARRTGSSSPLGLLFDHGCDAVNSLFGSVNWIIAMALPVWHATNSNNDDDIWLAWILLFGPYGLFYIGTWEEYYTGSLILPFMNGPNEGLLGAALMSFASWQYGPTVWQQCTVWEQWIRPLVIQPLCGVMTTQTAAQQQPPLLRLLQDSSLRNADILILLSTIGFVQEIGIKLFVTTRRFGWHVLTTLIPFVTLLVTSLAVGADIWLRMPRTSLHLFATLFCEMTTDLMLAHITKQSYVYLRLILLPQIVLTALVVSGYWSAGSATTDLYLVVYTTAAFTFFMIKSVIVIQEVAHVLQIWCFDIVTPRKKKSRNVSSADCRVKTD